jgi:glycosyltransferase involved in cell wall biosynthesis
MRSLYLACPAVRGPGGIAAYARSLLDALHPDPVDVLGQGAGPERFDLPLNASFLGSPRSQPAFAAQLARDYLLRPPTVFLFAHVGLTLPLALLPRRPQHRVLVIGHGYEVWSRLSLRRGAALNRIDSLVFTTQYNRALFLAGNRDRVSPELRTPVIPLSAARSLESISPFPTPASPKRRALFVGRLVQEEPLKGISMLLRAAQKLPSSEWEIVIIGDGDARAHFQQQAATLGVTDRVKFLGWVDDATRSQMLADSDLLCLPSAQEGFGIVLLEAMVAGRPSIGAAAGAIPEVLHSEVGETVPYEDDVALAAAMQRVSDRLRSGAITPESIRRHYDERFAWGKFRDAWRAHLAELQPV